MDHEPRRRRDVGTRTRPDGWQLAVLRLPFRRPLFPDNLLGHLVATAVPGVEEWRGGAYRRTLALPHGPGIAALSMRPGHVAARFWLQDLQDLPEATGRCRQLLDLDADPAVIDDALAADPVLAPMVRAAPGRRVPRTTNGAEMTVRLVIGQQISTKAARTHAARLVTAYGTPVNDPEGALRYVFPGPARLVDAADERLAMPRSRRRTLRSLCAALASGAVDVSSGADRAAARDALLALPGIGPWTVENALMRALGDPDAFPATDLGVRRALEHLELPPAATERWRPWRAYAVQHLWATLDHEINHLPERE